VGHSKIYEDCDQHQPRLSYLSRATRASSKAVDGHVCGPLRTLQELLLLETNRTIATAWPTTRGGCAALAAPAQDTVEDFIDTCLSLENLIARCRRTSCARPKPKPRGRLTTMPPSRQASTGCAPRATLSRSATPRVPQKHRKSAREVQAAEAAVPEQPQRDVNAVPDRARPARLLGRSTGARLSRAEAYYFAPQAMTQDHERRWAFIEL